MNKHRTKMMGFFSNSKKMRTLFIIFFTMIVTSAFNQQTGKQVDENVNPPASKKIECGEFVKIFDQSTGEQKAWYINDHCIIQDHKGTWHMLGITHEEPADPLNENNFAHATADSLFQQPWSKEAFALTAYKSEPWNEYHLWAPHIIYHENQYYMFYCAGGETHTSYKIHLAVSKDMKNWSRHPSNPMVVDGFDARDPNILKLKDKWIMYYTANRPAEKGNHVVMAVESKDLINWTNKQVVYTDPEIGTYGGPTESPFVVCRNNKYYLFVCTNNPYDNTAVYESDSPFQWDNQDKIADFPAHCAEVIQKGNDWYISRAGWGKEGLYLARLKWND